VIPVITCDKSGFSPLDTFQDLFHVLVVWIPNGICIFQWADHYLRGHVSDQKFTILQVPLNKSKGLCGFGLNVGDMLVPFKLVVDGNSKVFGTADFFKGMAM
jgi:hypothetical protein